MKIIIFNLLINTLTSYGFINYFFNNKFSSPIYSHLSLNKLRYINPYIQRTTNTYLSLESEFEEIKKKYIKNNNSESLILYETNQLTLLNNYDTKELTNKWINIMTNKVNKYFPHYIYSDIFLFKDYCNKNYKKIDFYVGFCPNLRKCNYGPYFIGAFYLDVKDKKFLCKQIIQNPSYLDDDQSFFSDFRKDVYIMCERANVKFDFNDLKHLKNKRYYMAWKYSIDI